MKKCEDIQGRLTLYLDNELQGDERATVETHLSECESCAAIFARELNFLNAVRESGRLHVASSALREKVDAILNDGQVLPAALPPKIPRHSSRFRWVVAVAAGLLVLLLPVLMWRAVRQTETPSIGRPSSFALRAAETHLRHIRGQLPLEMESARPQDISEWFSNKVNFSVTGAMLA